MNSLRSKTNGKITTDLQEVGNKAVVKRRTSILGEKESQEKPGCSRFYSNVCFINNGASTQSAITNIECSKCQQIANLVSMKSSFVQCSQCHLFYDLMCAQLNTISFVTLKSADFPYWCCVNCSSQNEISNIGDKLITSLCERLDIIYASKEVVDGHTIALSKVNNLVHLLDCKLNKIESKYDGVFSNCIKNDELQFELKITENKFEKALGSLKESGCLANSDGLEQIGAEKIKHLDSKIDEINKLLRSNNLLLRDVPKSSGELTDEFILKISQHIKMKLIPGTDYYSYRQQSYKTPEKEYKHPAPIMIKFMSINIRNQFYSAYLKHTKEQKFLNLEIIGHSKTSARVFINEHLSSNTAKTFLIARDLRKKNRIAQTFTMNGDVYIKKTMDGPRIKIRGQEDLHKYE